MDKHRVCDMQGLYWRGLLKGTVDFSLNGRGGSVTKKNQENTLCFDFSAEFRGELVNR